MCGIAGYILRAPTGHQAAGYIDALLGPIRQRGPDDEGLCLINREKRSVRAFRTDRTSLKLSYLPPLGGELSLPLHDAALIHTRYSIIDLTEGGHQPFVSSDGTITAVFNGEIYNYLELREELSARGVVFRTHSDTEVLVEGYRLWGHDLWNRMNGFWAVAMYNVQDRVLILSRDRIGVAPLYYRETPRGLFFASSIRSLVVLEPCEISCDTDVLVGFVQTGIKDHENKTVFHQIKSIPSATTLILPGDRYTTAEATSHRYWHLPSARLTEKDISLTSAVTKLRETIFHAIELRLRADVKVAFELSGGLDSSSVVAAAANLRNNNITSYTIKVPDADEEPYARAILETYPIDYRVLSDLEDTFVEDIYPFTALMEEPFHSPNIYTHYRMRRLMKREGVSVVVMGAGGDEVLAGYEASFWPKAYGEMKQGGHLREAYQYELRRRFMTVERTRASLIHLLKYPYKRIRSLFKQEPVQRRATPTRASALQSSYYELPFHEQSLYHFMVALIPYYMRSNDHFTMAIPLEHRFPFLDYRIVELGLQMPVTYLFRNGWTKYLLRKAMEPYLPKKIVWRRQKMGFPFPYKRFLSANRHVFLPLLDQLSLIDFPLKEMIGYDHLLQSSPPQLWRLISTAIWVQQNLQDATNENRRYR
jgi:asparagine synthase (glutamine-hydrolysing)